MAIAEELFNHGDASANETISLMAAPFCNNVPYFEGVGNFGTRVTPNEFGAARYVYVQKNKVIDELIFKDLPIVELKENDTGTNMEPITFLPLIPNVLLNGTSGIAVGWSTDILPRNIKDIINATINSVKGKKINRLKPSYDYNGCKVEHIENNSWYISGEVKIENSTTVRVVNLPPELTLEKFKEKLNKMEDENKIQDYTDNSAEFIDVEIKFKREILSNLATEEKVIDYLKLKQKKTERIVVLNFNNTSIKQYDNEIDLINDFTQWRLKWYVNRYEKMLKDDSYELQYWKALKECFDKKLPSKLSSKNSKKEIEEEVITICKNIQIDDEQVNKISSLPSYRWAKDSYNSIIEKIELLESNIKDYTEILASEEIRKEIYIEELEKLKSMF